MSSLIIGIIIFIGGTIIKNVLKEMNSPGSVTGKMPTPPVVNAPTRMSMPSQATEPARMPQTTGSGSVPYEYAGYETQPVKKQATKTQKKVNVAQGNDKKVSQEINQETKREETSPFMIDSNSVINGIIMSEVLGQPRARKRIF